MTMKATAYRNNGTRMYLGTVGENTKGTGLRTMSGNGDKVCALFDDCGDFTFVWSTKAKRWEFFDEDGSVIGHLAIERDEAAEYEKKMRYYREHKAAYDAQQIAIK